MSIIIVEFTVSVSLDIDSDKAGDVTEDDVAEMAANAVCHHHSGLGTQLICESKCQWSKPYVHGEMKSSDAEFASVYVEAEIDDLKITDVDEEFTKLLE